MAIHTVGVRPGVRPRVPASTLLGMLLLVLGMSPIAALFLSVEMTPGARLAWSVAGMTLVTAGCLALVRQRIEAAGSAGWARVGPAYVVYFGFAFGLASLAWLRPQGGSHAIVDPANVPAAVLVATIALVAWTVGYCVGPPRLVTRAAARILIHSIPGVHWRMRFRSVPLVLYGIATLARVQRIREGRFAYLQDVGEAISSPSSLNQLLALTEGLALCGVVLAALDAAQLSRSLRSRLVLVVLAGCEIVVGLFAASKETVLLTLAAIGLVWVFSRDRLPRFGLIAAMMLVLVVFPYNTAYRDTIRQDQAGSLAPEGVARAIPVTASATLGQLTPRAFFVDSPAQVSARVRQIDNIAVIGQRTPERIPYRSWSELIVGPVTGLVPRALWPGKPVLSTGLDFSEDYYDLPASVQSSSAVTVPGDLLRHGGITPLVIGMVLVGMLVRTVDRTCDPGRDARHLLFFVPLFTMLIKSESDVVVLVVGLIQTTVILMLVSRFAFVTRPSPAEASAGSGTNRSNRR
jgi:hypothetical protein